MWINVYIVPFWFLAVLLLPKARQPFAVLMCAMLAGFNALVPHLGNFSYKFFALGQPFTDAYNPGFIQSLLINVPFNFYVIYKLYQSGLVSMPQIILAQFVVGFPGHFPIAGGSALASYKQLTTDSNLHLANFSVVLMLLCVPFLITPTEKAAKKVK